MHMTTWWDVCEMMNISWQDEHAMCCAYVTCDAMIMMMYDQMKWSEREWCIICDV